METHASNVLRKTQQSNRSALTRWAYRRKIVWTLTLPDVSSAGCLGRSEAARTHR